MIKKVKLPKQIRWASEHPMLSFFKKSLLNAKFYLDESRFRVDVTKFTINPKDEKFLKSFIKMAAKKERPYLKKSRIESIVEWEWLCNGPATSNDVEPGTVWIDMKACLIPKEGHL